MNDSKLESAPEVPRVNIIGMLFFNEDGEVLLLRRKKGTIYFPLHYHLLSGKMDPGETPGETLNREAWEEAQITDFKVLESYEPFEDPFKDKIYVVHLFKGYLSKNTEIVLNEEHIGYKWVPIEKIPDYDLTPGLTKDLEVMGLIEPQCD